MPETGDSCVTCAHYIPSNEKGGICRRYPPQVMMVPGQIVGQLAPANLFPAVGAGAWCGEYAKDRSLMAESESVDSRLSREAEGEA